MSKKLSQIEFYFPEGNFNNKKELTDAIISEVKEKDSLAYCGYSDKKHLKKGLLNHLGEGDISQYKIISDNEKRKIKKIITNTVEECNEKLSVPTKNFVFVNPYLTTESDEVFNGVMAVAVYSCVFHLFINLDEYTDQSLINTVPHELNHTIYYYNHYDDFNNYTLLDEIILEGLAENFKEEFFDSERTPWAGALSKDKAFKILENSRDKLNSRDQSEINKFLFGINEKDSRWKGYSAGFWLVKEFIDNNQDLSWDEIMKIDREEFLKELDKN